jgi:excisionase family DNA binding protein
VGRPREVGNEQWATVTEVAETLNVSYQAIRHRMERGTIPYEQHIDSETGRPHYRIPRSWLEEHLRKHDTPATRGDAEERTAELMAAFAEGVETIRGEVERQHTQLVPLSEQAVETQGQMLENQQRVLNSLEAMQNAQNEMFRQVREATARLEEADRREREYQMENLQLQRELRDLVKEARAESNRARAEREAAGERERRSWWRRLFGS